MIQNQVYVVQRMLWDGAFKVAKYHVYEELWGELTVVQKFDRAVGVVQLIIAGGVIIGTIINGILEWIFGPPPRMTVIGNNRYVTATGHGSLMRVL